MKKFIIFLFFASLVSAQSVNVPLDYWGYDFIERCEAKGLFSSVQLKAKPVTRSVFATILEDIKKSIDKLPHKFTKTDQRLYEQLLGDFHEELGITEFTEKHFYTRKEPHGEFHFDLLGQETIVSNKGGQYDPDELISETTMGGILRGNLGQTLGFYVDARNTVIRGRDEEKEMFNLDEGSPFVTSGKSVITDRALSYFVWEKPWLRLQIGKDELNWGPAYRDNLTISQNMPPANMLRLGVSFKNLHFSSTHAILSSSLGSKYLTAHRIDWQIMPGIILGGSETVVYGDRNIEMSYLNPLMPYHVAEHHLGDLDNNTMSADITINKFWGMRFFGEFFIDDMTTTKSMTKFYGNKWAVSLGSYIPDVFRLSNFDMRLRYTRIEPFVYCNDEEITIYTHYDKVIGHWLGPNTDYILLNLLYSFNRDFRIETSFEHIRSGPGEPSIVTGPTDGTEIKEFLGDLYETRQLFSLKLVDQIRRDIFVRLSYQYSLTDNLFLTDNLSSTDHLVRFECFINY